MGYSPWGSKESDMTEGLTLSHFFTFFFMVQLSHPYMTTGKTIALTRRIFVGKVVSLLLSTLSRFVHSFPSKEQAASNFMAGAVDRDLFSRNFPVPVLLCCPVSKCLDRGSCDYLSPSLESPSLQGHQLPPSSTLGKEGLGLGIFRNGNRVVSTCSLSCFRRSCIIPRFTMTFCFLKTQRSKEKPSQKGCPHSVWQERSVLCM